MQSQPDGTLHRLIILGVTQSPFGGVMATLVMWMSVTLTATASLPSESVAWWDAQVVASLDRAPSKKADWVHLLEKCPDNERPGLAYLIKYLPLKDLETLTPRAFADNLALAYQARAEVPWGPGLPEDIFLDAVLPHASVTEPRDSMRAEFHTRYLPLVRRLQNARPGGACHQQETLCRLQSRLQHQATANRPVLERIDRPGHGNLHGPVDHARRGLPFRRRAGEAGRDRLVARSRGQPHVGRDLGQRLAFRRRRRARREGARPCVVRR